MQSKKTEIATRTLNLIKRYAPDEIDMDTPVSDLDIDSLAMFEIVYELEESFAVELDEDVLYKIDTVRDLVNAIHKEANQAGADIPSLPPQSGD